jgi:hypothetical protein
MRIESDTEKRTLTLIEADPENRASGKAMIGVRGRGI